MAPDSDCRGSKAGMAARCVGGAVSRVMRCAASRVARHAGDAQKCCDTTGWCGGAPAVAATVCEIEAEEGEEKAKV